MNLHPHIKPVGRFSPERLFRPDSVAVIGAASEAGAQVMANLMAGHFAGPILPVDPGLRAVEGVLAYPDIASLPIAPDLAVIASTGGDQAAPIIEALAARGTFAAIVVGMASDLGPAAARTGVRVLGPGSFGISVPAIGLNASRSHLPPRKGRLALVSQSAALCRAVLDWSEPNGVGFSHIVGVGGNIDMGFGRVLDWLSRDTGTGAILLDIRLIKDRRAFLSSARAAARLRPVVAIRAGGRLIDPSGLADLAFDAALRRAGVLSVSRLEDLLTAAETLTRARPARNERLVIVTNAIGPAQMAADMALRDGLSLASLPEETEAALRAMLPGNPGPARPGTSTAGIKEGLVYVGLDAPMRLAEVTKTVAAAPGIGGVLVVHAPTGPKDGEVIAALGTVAHAARVPVLVCALGETTGAVHRHELGDAGVPAFSTPEQAVRGFVHLVQDRRNRAAARELPPSAVLEVAPNRNAVATSFAAIRAAGRLTLAQDEAMMVLAAYGVPTAPSFPVLTADAAVTVATGLGYPVVIKLRRSGRPGPSGQGALMLDLHDETEVRAAIQTLAGRRSRRTGAGSSGDSGGYADGFLVQRQFGRARELLVQVRDDPTFGPTIAVGEGGSTADGVRDVAMDLPPLNLPLARSLLAQHRIAAVLAESHDRPAADREAVAEALVRISQMIVDFPEIAEIDINPLFADATGVNVADAWIRLRGSDGPSGQLALPPYPAELVEEWTAHSGERFTIRPIRPEDAEQHAAMFTRLSPEDIRFRFFSTIRELSPEQVTRLTQVDYDREMAFVAVSVERGEIVGVSRLVCEMDRRQAEFAVLVQPDMKGKGMASHLMQRIMDWGKSAGITDMRGQVLADNAPMLSFVRHLGFHIARIPGENEVVEASLALVEVPPPA